MPTKRERPEEIILFTQSATQIVRRLLFATDGLTFNVSASNNFKILTASDTITFSDSNTVNRLLYEECIEAILFTQNLEKTSGVYVGTSNSITFNENLLNNIKYGVTSSILTFNQETVPRAPIEVLAANNISFPLDVDLSGIDLSDPEAVEELFSNVGLRGNATVNIVCNVSANNMLNFVTSAGPAIQVSASNHLHFNDLAEKVLYESLLDGIVLLQSLVVNVTQPLTNVLELTHNAELDNIFPRIAINTLNLDNIITFYRVGDLCIYDPGVGEGPSAPSMVTPTLVHRSTIILTYPYPQYTKLLELRNPIFDDVHQLENRRINRKTRGGTLKIFRDPIWPSAERLIYSFDNLKERETKDLLEFLEISIGQEIGLLDFESRQWRGYILTPTTQVQYENLPGLSVTFEFEGVLDPGGLEANILSFSKVSANATEIPPGFQALLTVTGSTTADVLRT